MTAVEWCRIIRSSPAEAYWDLIRKVRRGEATMIPATRGLYWDKWTRRVRTRFDLKEGKL